MWKTIEYEPCYEVSDKGQVRNKGTKKCKNFRASHNGYLRVTLYPSGKTYTVHRLVADAFCDRPVGTSCVNHMDGDKLNNTSKNLEWTTPKLNVRHAIDTKLMSLKDWSGVNNPGSKLDKGLVFSMKFGVLSGIPNAKLASMLKVKEDTIRKIRIGSLWGHITKD